jgi:hypothetical protein
MSTAQRHVRRSSSSSSSSDSDSDSSSSSSAGETRAKTGKSVTAQAAPTTREVNPVERPKTTQDPVRTFGSSNSADPTTKLGSPSTLNLKFDLLAPFSALDKHKGGAQKLRIDTASNTLTSDDIFYSNPEHNTPESLLHGPVDFATSIKVKLNHQADTGLLVTTPVRATKSEKAFADPSTVTAANPYGNIAILIGAHQSEGSFIRNPTPGTLQFIQQFPGQTESNVGHWVRDIPQSTESHIRTNPPSAVAYFHDAKVQDDAQKLEKATVDKHGYAYGDRKRVEAALAETKAAIAANIAYSNLSDPSKLGLDIGLPHKRTLADDGTVTKKQLPLKTAFKAASSMHDLAKYTSAKVRSGEMTPETAAQHMSKAQVAVAQTAGLDLSGNMEITYYHVDPNFKLDG